MEGELNRLRRKLDEVKGKLEESQAMLKKKQQEIELLDEFVKEDQKTKERYSNEIKELISLNLWSARRLHKTHKDYAYTDLEKITKQKYQRL